MSSSNPHDRRPGAFVLAAALLAAGGLSTEAAAVMLQVDASGQLTGALGVEVDGALYDVEFVEGTCLELFPPCFFTSPFIFGTLEAATAAAQALLDTVFLDGPAGSFDSDPGLTAGCDTGLGACGALVPFDVVSLTGVSFAVRLALALNTSGDDETSFTFFEIGFGGDDSREFPAGVWARFSEAALVPEPSALALWAGGLTPLAARLAHSRLGRLRAARA